MNFKHNNFTHRTSTYYLIICVSLLSLLITPIKSYATFQNVYGPAYGTSEPSSAQYCSPGQSVPGVTNTTLYFVPTCTLNVPDNNYVPKSGNYRIVTEVGNAFISSPYVTLKANAPISQQDISFPSSGAEYSQWSFGNLCYYVYGNNQYYRLNGFNYTGCKNGSRPPIPPDPPAPPTSCTLNNSNALNVNLGTLDRSLLVTVPGTGSARHIQIPVSCTGDATTIDVDMKLSYTPLSVGGKEVVKTSTNGLGVSIIYNNTVLSTTDTTTLSFVPGSNQLDLAFEAMRDPTVVVGDVATGAFSASATLIMTQL
ncbi:fimbrial protein [Enterobacter roggenkampii]|nr:fimbrial protein [Enterobacter roggenkampii]